MFYHQTQETECDHLDYGILGCVSKPQRQKMFSITVHSNLHCSIGIPKQGNHSQKFSIVHCFLSSTVESNSKTYCFPTDNVL